MATGHTAKKTLTDYRAGLLRKLKAAPIPKRACTATERRQYNEMAVFRWVVADGSAYQLAPAGADLIAAQAAE